MTEIPARGVLQRLGGLGRAVEDTLLVLFLAALILLAGLQIVLRNFFDAGFPWMDGVLRALVLWVALLGAVAASRDAKHISIDVLSRFMSSRWKPLLNALLALFTACVCGIAAWYCGLFVHGEYQFHSAGPAGIPAWALQVILPLAFGLIAWRYLILALRHAFGAGDSP